MILMHTEWNVIKVCNTVDCSAASRALYARWSSATVRQHRRDRSCCRITLTVSTAHRHDSQTWQRGPFRWSVFFFFLVIIMLVVFVIVAVFRIRRNETNSSLSSYIHYDFLQKNLKSLEDENLKLRAAVGLHRQSWCGLSAWIIHHGHHVE